jgi:hypothetical protein
MKSLVSILGMTLFIVSACVSATPSYAQRSQGDYKTFMSYYADNCATLTPSGNVAFGCPLPIR